MNEHILNLNDIEQKKQQYVAKLAELIKNLPDNPNINRVGKGCYTMSIKDIFSHKGNLSASYYDFAFQYKFISETIVLAKDPVCFLQKVVLEKQVIKGNHKPLMLHPDVVEQLKKLIS